MFVFSIILSNLAWMIDKVLFLYTIILMVRILISWVNADPYNEIVRVIYVLTEPYLAIFRRLPLQIGGIDFSPVIAFIALSAVRNIIVSILYQIVYRIS